MLSKQQKDLLGNEGSVIGLSYQEYRDYLEFIIISHDKLDVTGRERFRQLGKTPYPTHPVFAAHLVLADRRVPWDDRIKGFKALLLHDILENTKAALPEWVEPDIRELVERLTFREEKTAESVQQRIDTNKPFVNYILLADTLSNLYEEHVSVEKRDDWITGMKYLAEKIKKDYSKTRIYQISLFLVENTDWTGDALDVKY